MPDFTSSRGPGEGPVRRPVRAPVRHYGPGGLPTEGAEPAPKPWPIAPWLALIFIVGFIALQAWPATHFRHPNDPTRTWVPIVRDEYGINHVKSIEAGHKIWGTGRSDADDVVESAVDGHSKLDGADSEMKSSGGTKRAVQNVQIFLSTDEKDLRPLAVVINSTISNARHPERIKFHLVIPRSETQLEYWKFKASFPSASIEIVSDGIDFSKISKLIKYRKESKSREALSTVYNFLPYYLPDLAKSKDIAKIIYLDTDVVVKGDIEELYRKSLEGYPVAAVTDCSQKMKIYFDFEQLEKIRTREIGSKRWLPKKPFDEEECVFNRGALLIDVNQWIQQNVTQAIEWWMKEYNDATDVFYKYGQSQPPFLLALNKNYKELEHAWNIRGLGRDHFSDAEQDYLQEVYGHRPDKKPFLSMESDYAKILHFNGEFKPWKRDRVRLDTEDKVSVCGEDGQECYKLWWEYLSPFANDAFKHTI